MGILLSIVSQWDLWEEALECCCAALGFHSARLARVHGLRMNNEFTVCRSQPTPAAR